MLGEGQESRPRVVACRKFQHMCRPNLAIAMALSAGRMFLWIRTNPLPSLQRWKAQCVMVRQAPISYGMTYGDLMVLRQPISLVKT